MSLNPSSRMAAQTNPGKKIFPNLARKQEDTASWAEVDAAVLHELQCAGIKAEGPHEFLRKPNGEVPTAYIGSHCLWSFRRAWYYWIASGPGIPPDKAEEFHKTWGQQVRVEGHCGCPSPLEWRHGFAIGSYHIDTLDGLCAFVKLLKSIYVSNPKEKV